MLDMHIRPSQLMGLNEEYLAFCFDEVCAFIINKMQEGEKPIIKINNESKPVSKPSDVYNKYIN